MTSKKLDEMMKNTILKLISERTRKIVEGEKGGREIDGNE